MKKLILITGVSMLFVGLNSCKKKEECHECHYEKMQNGTEVKVELGKKCGSDLENLEKNGYTDSNGTKYDVHCHEH